MLIEVKDFFEHADAVDLLEEKGIEVIEHSDPYKAMCRCEIAMAIENILDETYGTISEEKIDALVDELKDSFEFKKALNDITNTAELIVRRELKR